jgi:predicted aconitase/predicted aconitase with swiveling domain
MTGQIFSGGNSFFGTAYVKGRASGTLVASNLELSFWGGVNPQTGEIIDRHHPLSGQYLEGTVLAIPGGRGSCSGSGVILELLMNGKGPNAILFERREDILTLGVVVAEEIFHRRIPVVTLNGEDFQQMLKLNGSHVHVNNGHVSGDAFITIPEDPMEAENNRCTSYRSLVELSPLDRAFVDGSYGEAASAAMRIIQRMADIMGARELMSVSQVHVDGCIYTGPGSLAFALKLRDWGGRVVVPTSLNSISIDMKRWRAQGIDSTFGENAAKLASVYTDMGARPTFTCAPYQLESAPKFGDQVAWAESNAVVYANSVLGARTMKYPDFLDIAIALTGRAPKGGPHIEVNRRASLIVRISQFQQIKDIDDSFYPLLGYHTGTLDPTRIPVVLGIKALNPSKDDLKAFGAAFATVSSAPMFHIVGITPEAVTLDAVIGNGPDVRSVDVNIKDLAWCWDKLNSARNSEPVDLVSLGNPHFSFKEIEKLAKLCRGRFKKDNVTIVVTCGRSSYGLACQAGVVEELERFGVSFLTDTCWCMITEPTIPRSENAIITNSGKYAHYGPGLTGRRFYFGSLARCVEAACQDGWVQGRPQWLVRSTV